LSQMIYSQASRRYSVGSNVKSVVTRVRQRKLIKTRKLKTTRLLWAELFLVRNEYNLVIIKIVMIFVNWVKFR
jgi:hypothetical protein